jgi:hypothetical protein
MESTMPDAPTSHLSEEVAGARDALIAHMQADADAWWSTYELKIQVRNGWSPGAMSLALNELVDDGTLEARGDEVRLSG